MIQTTTPTLNASALQTAATASHAASGMPGADFAALLGLGAVLPEGAAPQIALPVDMVTVETMPQTSLPDALRGTQQGLAALALQVGAAASRPVESTALASPVPLVQIAQSPLQRPASAAVPPGVPPLPATSQVALTAALVPTVLPDGGVKSADLPMQMALTKSRSDLAAELPAPSKAEMPAPSMTAAGFAAPPLDGKGGKATGKMLPPADLPAHHKADAAIVDAKPAAEQVEPAAAGQIPVAAIGVVPTIADVAVVATAAPALIPQSPPTSAAEAQRPMSRAPSLPAHAQLPVMGRVAPSPARDGQPNVAAPIAHAGREQTRAVRFEPIEIVGAEAPESASAPIAPSSPTMPASPAPSEAAQPSRARLPVDAAVEAPDPGVILRVRGAPSSLPDAPKAVIARAEPLPRFQASSVAAAPGDRPVVPQAAAAAARAATPPQQSADTPGAPASTAQNTADQTVPAERRPEAPNTAPARGENHASAAAEAEIAPVTRHPVPLPAAQPVVADAPQTPVVAAPDGASAPSPVPSETPQDFDTLVSRLAEAREAATPHVVRTAMAHGEFGRVSMQLDHSDGGLSVTLASRDPEFTGAVQAAAAAMASNASAGGDQPRQDGSSAQQNNAQNQAQSGAQTNASGGQGQQPRADASGQQPGQQSRREGGGFSRQQDQQQPGTPARDRGQQRSGGGIYA